MTSVQFDFWIGLLLAHLVVGCHMCILVIPTSRWLTFVQIEPRILVDYMFPYLPMSKTLYTLLSSMTNISYLFSWLFPDTHLDLVNMKTEIQQYFRNLALIRQSCFWNLDKDVHLSVTKFYVSHAQTCI